ncbi:DNA polymerase III subunit [Salegentibacter sp. T436]|jgi:DNA polymerase-3 subunit delta'|uniref:DNA polymerase III subunit n=1 Tax=Salegentibacter sp. T436 TaxID=1729720 RepID=UPI00094A6996|nr:DNA polymerase III subunit delta' [Salegentibacter sp. T436]APS38109.1 DNA polymerase III subunit delta' [Salegentibacter sp. T436]
MLFEKIIGLQHLKKHLTTTVDNGRVPHAQLFVGKSGSGTLPLAIAYAQYILCKNKEGENNSGNSNCNERFKKLAHPDLHFAFPVAANQKIKKHPVSSHFLEEWREFVKTNPYGSLFEWYQKLGIENKQGQIGVDEAQEVVKSLSLKAYEGGFKIMIIWMAEKMNTAAANKLLKLIEEPPNNTLFLLVTEDEEQIIQTIRSRCQKLHFPPLPEDEIAAFLEKNENCSKPEALKIAHQANGSYTRALHLLQKDSGDQQFETWFINWVRSAFKAKGNRSTVLELIAWSEEIAGMGRESQKNFLLYCIDFFRQALMLNYKAEKLVYLEPATPGFKLEKFAPFVHGNNIKDIIEALEEAIYHIERNGNAKIILTDLSIRLTRYLHKKAA